MTGMNWFQVWQELPLCDAYGLEHQARVAAGYATAWPSSQAAEVEEIQTKMRAVFKRN